MKKLILGIGIILFAILFKLCSSGSEAIALIIGIVGLCFSIAGFIDKEI